MRWLSWTIRPRSDLFPGLSARHPREAGSFSRRVFLERSAARRARPLCRRPAPRRVRRGEQRRQAPADPPPRPISSSPARTTRSTGRSSTTTRRSRRASSRRAGRSRSTTGIDYLWTRIMQAIREGVRRRRPADDVLHEDEAIAEALDRRGRLRRLLPLLDRLGRLVVGKHLQPLNHDYLPNLQTTIWPSFQTRSTTRARSTPSRTRLHDRDRLPHRQGRHDARRAREPVRDLLGPANKGKTFSSTTAARRRPCCSAERDHRHQHRGARADREREAGPARADRRRQRQELDRGLLEDPRGHGLGAPGLVGEHGRGAVLPAEGRRARGARVLVPRGRRADRQRHDRASLSRREEPGPRSPLPELHARREERATTTSPSTSATSRRS